MLRLSLSLACWSMYPGFLTCLNTSFLHVRRSEPARLSGEDAARSADVASCARGTTRVSDKRRISCDPYLFHNRICPETACKNSNVIFVLDNPQIGIACPCIDIFIWMTSILNKLIKIYSRELIENRNLLARSQLYYIVQVPVGGLTGLCLSLEVIESFKSEKRRMRGHLKRALLSRLSPPNVTKGNIKICFCYKTVCSHGRDKSEIEPPRCILIVSSSPTH